MRDRGARKIKKPRGRGAFHRYVDDYFFFVAFFFFAGAFFVAIFNSPPILTLFTTIAHLLLGKLAV